MGYTVLSAVEMTPYLESAAQQIADRLPFDIVVTSGVRTARRQAQAMFTKIELGDDLLAIYSNDSFAQGVMDAYPDLEEATQFVQGYFDAGGGSSHGRGLGLDLRTRDQSESNIAEMIAVSDALGFRPLREYTPPHLHLTLPPQEKKSLPWILAAGIVLWTFTR
jgi:hypothetical protein